MSNAYDGTTAATAATAAGHAHPTPSEEKAATTSLGELVTEVTKDFSTLMRQEIELAKAEATESAKKAGKGAGLLGGAGYAAIMLVLFLSLTLMWAIGALVNSFTIGALVVAVIWGIIALVLYLMGRKELKQVKGLPKTTDSVKKIPDTFKRNEENR